MGYRRIFVLACVFTIAAWAGVGATGDELPSKDHPSPEPFGDLQPFDLSKRPVADSKTDAKESEAVKAAPQPDTNHALQRNAKVAEDILKVNELGDPQRIVFEGAKLFPEKQLRLALACDLKYQAAARPSNQTGDYLAILEKRLREGYLHSGCPNATVSASRDDKRKTIIVNIKEGARYRKGEIRLTGSHKIDEQAVRAILTTPQRKRVWDYVLGDHRVSLSAQETPDKSSDDEDADPVVVWKSGEAVDFCGTEGLRFENGIRFALAELGFIASSFRFELDRDEKLGLAHLHITILHEAPQAVVGEIEVSGLKRDSREALQSYLGVAPNDPLNSKTLQRIDERLSASCRYWTRKIDVLSADVDRSTPSLESSNPKLSLKLEEYAPTPPLAEPLSPVDETLKKCSDWLNSLAGDFGDRDLVCTVASADLGGLAQHAQIALAADGTIVVETQFISDKLHIDHSAVLGQHSVEIYDWKSADKFCFSREASPVLQIRTNTGHAPDGKQDANLVLGCAFRNVDKMAGVSPMRCDVRVEPVVLLDISRKRLTKAELKDNVLKLSDDGFELQIDQKTGQIRSVKSASFLSAGISAIDLRSENNFVSRVVEKTRRRGAKFDDRCDPKQPVLSGVSYAFEQVARQPMAGNSRLSRRLLQAGAVVPTDDEFKRFFADLCADLVTDTSADDYFSIPGRLEISYDKLSEDLEYYAPYLADKLFPRGSFPWTYLREYGFLFQRVDGNYADCRKMWEQEDARLDSVHEYGPVSCLIRAWLWQQFYPDNPEPIVKNANDGLHNLSDEAFLKDVRYLTDGDCGLAVISRAQARYCREIVKDSDKDNQAPSRSGAHSVIRKLAARREAEPNEPLADTIRAVMLEEWHDGWKESAERELRSLATEKTQPRNEDVSQK